jgi:hypothetical protein
MKASDALWTEAKDEMGRTVWVNLSLARTIRLDPTGRCTLIAFDKDHVLGVQDPIDRLIDATPRTTAARPRNFTDPLYSRHHSKR